MLSHLFHRRGQSNPTSPLPDQTAPPEPSSALSPYPHDTLTPDYRPSSANSTALPPTLPPITRVTSAESDSMLDLRHDLDSVATNSAQDGRPPRSPYMNSAHAESASSFLGGMGLPNYRRGVPAGTRPDSSGSHEGSYARPRPGPSQLPTSAAPPTRPPPQPVQSAKPASSFVMPTEIQRDLLKEKELAGSGLAGPSAVRRRPVGTRLATEPANLSAVAAALEPPKGKKGLPFLKNPMSTLLARRKANQNVPDLTPLPIDRRVEEPVYDPRIRGTRVHDFSAPRPRRPNDAPTPGPALRTELPPVAETEAMGQNMYGSADLASSQYVRNKSNASDSERSGSTSILSQPITDTASASSDRPPRRPSRLDQKPLPGQPSAPGVPPKDDTLGSLRSVSSTHSRAMSADTPTNFAKSTTSVRTTRSRNVSISEMSRKDSLSALPRHMKSTSSRFSFDMIGAAKQEKLLEERHRQREAEKKTTGEMDKSTRDSRFDDFDEDGFDYDAMMDDDGLEERIPGVNADFDEEDEFEAEMEAEMMAEIEEEMDMEAEAEADDDDESNLDSGAKQDMEAEADPDNDQQNFAGFVFQRSNPPSAIMSPHTPGMMETPRDAEGMVIGFAMTKDTTPDLHPPTISPALPSDQHSQAKAAEPIVPGLGIQGLELKPEGEANRSEPSQTIQQIYPMHPPPRKVVLTDDLYFDDGLAEFENEFDGDGTPFDESIFDNNDTDQYGRPIPGAFARAQLTRTTNQDPSKRESDMTSRLSAHSAVSQSTAHTSLSAAGAHFPQNSDATLQGLPAPIPGFPATELEKEAVYHAALAAAAHKAAASGKFRRDSSPPPPEFETPTDTEPIGHDEQDLYDEDPYASRGVDDYELDDDDIIAEANASALANDSDGWYGQEFGFYSAPMPMPTHHGGLANGSGHSASSSTSGSSTTNFEYANGGYFGPSGVGRTTSGRMISREPNLTPITERSEYSNRNSIMSLPVPPIGPGGGLQSPGLAQLAMMADGADDMTFSALMRLRTKAWGGSQASLVSSREGSPRSDRGDGASSPWGPGAGGFLGVGMPGGHVRKNSAFSLLSHDSDARSGAGSPTLTMAMPIISSPTPPIPAPRDSAPNNTSVLSPISAGGASTSSHNGGLSPAPLFSPQPVASHTSFPPLLEDEEMQSSHMSSSGIWSYPTTANSAGPRSPDFVTSPSVPTLSLALQKRPGMGHRHKGSADSISYVKEDDNGEIRWVKERRRTAETGEVEILEREVVEGGRI